MLAQERLPWCSVEYLCALRILVRTYRTDAQAGSKMSHNVNSKQEDIRKDHSHPETSNVLCFSKGAWLARWWNQSDEKMTTSFSWYTTKAHRTYIPFSGSDVWPNTTRIDERTLTQLWVVVIWRFFERQRCLVLIEAQVRIVYPCVDFDGDCLHKNVIRTRKLFFSPLAP